ncbi:PAM68 family protein [Prochlorococcus sp. MIT 1307]|uniref:PAM68 family protein n=1 Tax=Prochlorococcus sp. MIT 1307 TaxID=3096219 RepID=UPI002A761D24|nr:PAM68 family protein [Prochlorococcus sp. MIT 1307]
MAEIPPPKPFKPAGKSAAAKPGSTGKALKQSPNSKASKRESAIPKEVANRMARRIAITTGLPTFSGMSVFIISYLLVSRGIADIPPALTLLTSAACFLTGLLGLSYGILSASWELSAGSLLGLENIRPNIGKVRDAFSELTKNKG